MKKKYAILIPAGGLGSRLYPLTKDIPKSLLPIYYTLDNEVIRLIDLPLKFCKKNNIPVYVLLNHKSDAFSYLKYEDNVKLIYTNKKDLKDALFEGLLELKKDNIEIYSVYAPDFLIPNEIINQMLSYIDNTIEIVALCSEDNDYSKIEIKNYNGKLSYKEGILVKDLTFHTAKLDKSIVCFKSLINNNATNLWEYMYSKKIKDVWEEVKLLTTDIKHIDVGIPNSYYEAIYKLNKCNIDSNGNILFPNAIINDKSKNIIALPNSDSSSVILNNCIIPENAIVNNMKDVINVSPINKEYFNELKIKFYI